MAVEARVMLTDADKVRMLEEPLPGFKWSQVKKFRSFEEAKEFVRLLSLKTQDEWQNYCKSGRKPDDIPAGPARTYSGKGWVSLGDWLGTGFVACGQRKYRPFEEARKFARSLGLNNQQEWYDYGKSGRKPEDIPHGARWVYRDKWVSWGDWLGTGYVACTRRRYRPFKEAREFARGLGLRNQAEWTAYCKSGDKPVDVPATPEKAYRSRGWIDLGDWLGTGYVATLSREYRPFEEARDFARGLGLKGSGKWYFYCKSGKKPDDIPRRVSDVYKGKGWVSWGDWLGTGYVAHNLRRYRPFEEARAFARGLGLRNGDEWRFYCKSGKKPDDIPCNADGAYKGEGWVSWGDWLGTGFVANRSRRYRPFEEARAFVRGLGLRGQEEWKDYCTSGKKPDDIPRRVSDVYKGKGWVSLGDWLGTGFVATLSREYRPFEEARAFVRGLGLRGQEEWKDYCTSGKKPDDIPSHANEVYEGKGWVGMRDWLGNVSKKVA
jgi:hypothetical protein